MRDINRVSGAFVDFSQYVFSNDAYDFFSRRQLSTGSLAK